MTISSRLTINHGFFTMEHMGMGHSAAYFPPRGINIQSHAYPLGFLAQGYQGFDSNNAPSTYV